VNAYAPAVHRHPVLRVRYGTLLSAHAYAHSRPAYILSFTHTTNLHASVNAQTESQPLAAKLLAISFVRVNLTQAAPVMETTGPLTTLISAYAIAPYKDPNRLQFVIMVHSVPNSSTRPHASVKNAKSALLRALILRTTTPNVAVAAQNKPTKTAKTGKTAGVQTTCQTL
jgi:hypothetical protein